LISIGQTQAKAKKAIIHEPKNEHYNVFNCIVLYITGFFKLPIAWKNVARWLKNYKTNGVLPYHVGRDTTYDRPADIQYEAIQVLTFQAYTPQLNKIYARLVSEYAASKNLKVHIEGACYVIRTEY